jgi:TetR/AcrR family fatty acid metabolism transcriptional regulator
LYAPRHSGEGEIQITMKTKKNIVSEFRREEILNAARSIFARRGFALGIMDEIAKEAGIAKGTIYLYFRSKADIYRAVLHHDMKVLRKSTLERIDTAKSLRDKIGAFTLSRLENAEAQKEFFRIMDSEQGNLSMTRSQYREFLREPVLRLASALGDASQRGEIRPVPPEKVSWIIADMTRGTIQRRLSGQNDTSPGEDSAFLVDLIWASLAPLPDRPQFRRRGRLPEQNSM